MAVQKKGSKKSSDAAKGKGQPRAFETEQDFLMKFLDYIAYCRNNKRFANIAGFCAYCMITRETYYKQKEYYSDTYNKTQEILEDEVLQDNTYRAQLYLKNKFGYKDKTEIDQNIGNKDGQPFQVDTMTAEDRQKRAKEIYDSLTPERRKELFGKA